MDIKNIKLHCDVGETVYVVFLGDNHEGAKNHAKDKLQDVVSQIKELSKDNKVVIIGIGDYIDCINHKDPRFNPAEISEIYDISDLKNLPNKQMEHFLSDVEPILPLFEAWLYGNHEESYVKHSGADPMSVIEYWYKFRTGQKKADILGYDGWVRLGIVKDKNRKRPNYSFDVRVNHGTGGGGFREGYPINKCHDIFRWDIADIYVMGHIHQMATDVAYKKFNRLGNIKRAKTLYGVTGCFLYKSRQGSRGYYEGRPGKYSSIGSLMAKIKVGRKKDDCQIKWERLE